jgi:hypothetical protein
MRPLVLRSEARWLLGEVGMRKRLLLIGVLALAAVALLMWLRPTPGATPAPSAVQPPSTSLSGAVPRRPAASAPVSLEPSADAPPPRNTADGQIEVLVKSERGPIAGARVRLHLRGQRDPNTAHIKWHSVGSSITGRDGKAKFIAGPGRYLASARADGFATGQREIARPQGEQITVAEIELRKGLHLSGQTVARPGKGTVPLVEVVLTQEIGRRGWCRRPDAPEEEEEYAISDASGCFRFEGLARASYCVRARAPGFARWIPYSVAFPFPDALIIELTQASVIEGFVVAPDGKAAASATVQLIGDRETTSVETGEGGGFSAEVDEGIYRVQAQRGVEAGALPKPVSVAAGSTVSGLILPLGAGASIGGTIVSDAEGTPIAGASIAVSPHQRNGDSGRGVSDGLGQYLVQGLAPGSYDIAVDASGYSQNLRRGVTVTGGQNFSIDLKLLRKGTVEGRVADSAGRPIPGAVVSAETAWGSELEDLQAICGDDGRYRLADLAPGKVFLRARRNAGSSGLTQAVNVPQAGVSQLDFTLVETGVLSGKVSRTGGKPSLEMVWISVSEADGFGRRSEQVEADPTGNYRLELPPGDYRVHASARSSFSSVRTSRVTVESGKTATHDITLETMAPAFFGVVLEPDGMPAGRAQVIVSFSQNQGRSYFAADEDGRFEFPAPTSGDDTTYTVTASKGGRVGQLSNIVHGSGDVTVQLGPAASIEGRVLGPSGGLRGGFSLKMGPASMREAISFWESTLEFAGDTFFVDDVHTGTLKLEVRTADGQSGRAEANAAPGERVSVEIRVSPSGSVFGRLIEAETGKPVSDARVFTESSLPSPGSEVNLDGSFRIRDLAAGSYTLRAYAPRRAPFERKVTVAAAENVDLGNIELQARGRPPLE